MARDNSALRSAVLELDTDQVKRLLDESATISPADQGLLLTLSTINLKAGIGDPSDTFTLHQLKQLNSQLSMQTIMAGNLNPVRSAIQAASCFNSAEATTLSDFIMRLGCALQAQCEIASALINAGIDTNKRDPAGKTALHLAAEKQLAPLVAMMLNLGMAVNSRDSAGNTPLLALVKAAHTELVYRGAVETASHLVSAHADTTAVDSDRISVDQYCKRMPKLYSAIHSPGLDYTLIHTILSTHTSPTRSTCPEPTTAPPRKGATMG